MTDPNGIETSLVELTGQDSEAVRSFRQTYQGLTEEGRQTLGILLQDYLTQTHPLGRLDSKKAIGDALKLTEGIVELLNKYAPVGPTGDLTPESTQGLHLIAHLVTHALRTFPAGYLTSDAAQGVIVGAFGSVGTISDVVATDYYIGPRAVNQDATHALEEFFTGVPFGPTVQEMRSAIHPVDLILQDWYAAVKYVHNQEVAPNGAFLRDGTPLFRFAPDCIPYVYANKDCFPDLSVLKVDDGKYVEQWLRGTPLSRNGGKNRNDINTTTQDSWIAMLTGYVPNDNKAINGLYQRYNRPLLSTAIGIGLERRM
ncbi:MAG: hypothetical protein WC254_05385 [Candidatus Woesearchaeota archaeon]|jgi:hypothetical protein